MNTEIFNFQIKQDELDWESTPVKQIKGITRKEAMLRARLLSFRNNNAEIRVSTGNPFAESGTYIKVPHAS